MRGKIAIIVWLLFAPSVLADGGTVRFSGPRDGKTVTVFTSPSPPRVGIVDVSILVQDADSGQPFADGHLVVRATSLQMEQTVSAPATSERATNKVMRSALLELPEPGTWHLVVEGFAPPIEFDLEVGEALPAWLDLWPWIVWPVVAIGLFGVFQVLRRRP